MILADSNWTPESTLAFATGLLSLLASFASTLIAVWAKSQASANTTRAGDQADRSGDHAERLTKLEDAVRAISLATQPPATKTPGEPATPPIEPLAWQRWQWKK